MTATPQGEHGREFVARGRYADELEAGMLFRHAPGRTVSDADNVVFSTLTMNSQSLHLDHEFSKATEFGRPLVNSLFTLSTLVGLSVDDLTQGTTVANLGFSEVRFPAPVFVGDTLYAETTIVSVRPSSSRPGEGIVEFEHRAVNQHREIVAVARRAGLLRWSAPAGAETP